MESDSQSIDNIADSGSSDLYRQLLDTWVDEHADALFRFATARVRDPHTVEDLLQETYLAALKNYATFRGDATIRTWLVAILRLKIIDHYRRQSRETAVRTETRQELATLSRESRLQKWDCDPSGTIEKNEFWRALHQCLDKLPNRLSQTYLLREVDGFSTEEVCAALNITYDNLAVRIFRARAALRDCLDRNWFSKG